MRSRSALVLAIKKVTKENNGKLTPGIDGFKASIDKARGKLVDELINKDLKLHRSKPAFRKYIPKKNGKLRSLGIPTIKDKIYQEIIHIALEPEWEAKFEATVMVLDPKEYNKMQLAEFTTTLKVVSGVSSFSAFLIDFSLIFGNY